jgi:dolichol-phosphate mannosyltransferase
MTQLSVIIPCYNEEATIEQVIHSVYEALKQHTIQVVVVNDASSDQSLSILNRLIRVYPVLKVISHTTNRGKTAGVVTALQHCTGVYTIIQDADLEYQPRDIPSLISAIASDTHAIYGSRHKQKQPQFIYPHYLIGGLLITWIANLLYSLHITDVTTGYKMIRTSLLKQMTFNQVSRFGFCAEVTAHLGKSSIKIVEVPISYSPRSFAEGKKIRPKDALELIWTLVYYKFKKVLPLSDMA